MEEALRMPGRPQSYAVQAAIAALHARAPSYEDTDWRQIAGLYEVLLRISPSPVIELNHAAAVSMVDGPARALDHRDGDRVIELDDLRCPRADQQQRIQRGNLTPVGIRSDSAPMRVERGNRGLNRIRGGPAGPQRNAASTSANPSSICSRAHSERSCSSSSARLPGQVTCAWLDAHRAATSARADRVLRFVRGISSTSKRAGRIASPQSSCLTSASAARRRVAFRENEIDHREQTASSLFSELGRARRHLVWNACVANLVFGRAHQSLRRHTSARERGTRARSLRW